MAAPAGPGGRCARGRAGDVPGPARRARGRSGAHPPPVREGDRPQLERSVRGAASRSARRHHHVPGRPQPGAPAGEVESRLDRGDGPSEARGERVVRGRARVPAPGADPRGRLDSAHRRHDGRRGRPGPRADQGPSRARSRAATDARHRAERRRGEAQCARRPAQLLRADRVGSRLAIRRGEGRDLPAPRHGVPAAPEPWGRDRAARRARDRPHRTGDGRAPEGARTELSRQRHGRAERARARLRAATRGHAGKALRDPRPAGHGGRNAEGRAGRPGSGGAHDDRPPHPAGRRVRAGGGALAGRARRAAAVDR